MIIHNAMFTNIDTVLETKMTGSLAFWTLTKAHCSKKNTAWGEFEN